MSYLDHIENCNRHDLSRYGPLDLGRTRIGWVRKDRIAGLLAISDAFEQNGAGLRLSDRLDSPDARTQAVTAAMQQLERNGELTLRGEAYRVNERWGAPQLMTVDRGAVTYLGIQAYGVHLNGFVRRADGLHLWVGKRAHDKAVAPGKLDNIVAGGQPAGLTLVDNLVKECAEEADIGEALARQAKPAGAITYLMEGPDGLKPDVMFCFDLELAPDFTPRNTDGEIAEFQLWPVRRVAETIRDTDAFKFNVNLVIIDFLLRHGILHPDSEPDYLRLVGGLRAFAERP
jgi:hypothetical protein